MKIFQGVIVPMVSPVTSKLEIDKEAVTKIVHSFIEYDSAPFILGTTGEATSLGPKQKLDLAKYTIEVAAGKMKTFVGISGTSLIESVDAAKAYRDLGADVMVTTLPYYYPITASEMTRFFEQLADQADCPIILYNMPAIVGERIPLDVAEKLSQHPNIVGMKDSERDIDRINQSIDIWKNREDFSFYLGWAAQSAHSILRGADGIVPSTGNFVPHLFQELYQSAVTGNNQKAFDLQQVTDELSLIYQKDRKLNASLPALKVIMSELGLCRPHAIPPMYDTPQDEQDQIKVQIREALNNLKR